MVTLSPDIILMIVDALEDFKVRRKLLEVCRDWRTLLISKVYSKVTLDSDESLLPLAHIANINTSFAATIRELRIPNLFEIDDSMDGLSMPELLPEPLKPLKWMNTGLVQDKEEFEFEDIAPQIWLVLVFVSLPNLRYLELRHFSYYPWNLVLRGLAQIVSNPIFIHGYRPLSHLEEVNIMAETASQNFPAGRFAPFFCLPAIRVFKAAGIHEEHEGMDWVESILERARIDLAPRSSPVRKIVLRQSNCRFGLRRYIPACANLEYFEYQHSNCAHSGDYWLDFRPSRFKSTLLSQKDSLRVLRLNDCGVTKSTEDIGMEDEEIYSGQESRIESWFGTLNEFSALRELRMPVRSLLGLENGQYMHDLSSALTPSLHEILPSSLEYLCLAQADQREFNIIVTEIHGLLEVRRSRFPALRTVVVQLYQMELVPGAEPGSPHECRVPVSTEERFEGIRLSCKAKGVDFSFAHDGEYQLLADGKVIRDTEGI